jgi:mannose-6-phosphate isomerase-like protein (cupin superfamily)
VFTHLDTRAGIGCTSSDTTVHRKDFEMATIVGPTQGKAGDLGGIGVRFMLWTHEAGGHVSVVEHPMAPRALAAPLHRHTREDEYSYVLEGRMGAMLGDDIVEAGPGDLVFKPRGQWHTFWNAGDEPARILELIAPAGFEEFFRTLTRATAEPDETELARLGARYGLELDFGSVPMLLERFGLRYDDEATPGV